MWISIRLLLICICRDITLLTVLRHIRKIYRYLDDINSGRVQDNKRLKIPLTGREHAGGVDGQGHTLIPLDGVLRI